MSQSLKRIRVLIADDNRVVRRAMRLQLEEASGITVVGEVTNGVDAVQVARAERADVVLMDIQMPQMSGLEATRRLAQAEDLEPVAVIVMTSFAIDRYVSEALDSGAVGYLLKSHDSDQLVRAIYAAYRGEAMVSSHVTAPLLKEFVRRGSVPGEMTEPDVLSVAERRVVDTLAGGITRNEDIASALHVSVHTVRSQLQSALKKLNLADRTQLALWGTRNGR